MTIGEQFKNFIKDENINQEDFLEFIDEKFDSVVEEYSLSEVVDFIIYHGDHWRLSAVLSLHSNIFRELEDIAKMIAQSGKLDLIQSLSDKFWKVKLFDVLSVCVKNQNTNFACEVLKKIKFDLNDISNVEFININKLFFLACLRNELSNIKILIKAGAHPGFICEDVNSIAVLERNKFLKSLDYVSKKFIEVKSSEKQLLLNGEIDVIIEEYSNGKSIEELSFYIAKFGGEIVNKKNKKGISLLDHIIETGNLKFFSRIFLVLNDRSESTIKELVYKAKNLNQYKIMNKLIEESVQ